MISAVNPINEDGGHHAKASGVSWESVRAGKCSDVRTPPGSNMIVFLVEPEDAGEVAEMRIVANRVQACRALQVMWMVEEC